ncbi:MAG: hypothetical protein ACKO37_08565 [Vampirovibrionales bacterium]
MVQVSSNFVELTKDAALKSFWRKSSLKLFLQNYDIPHNHLSSWDTSPHSQETKSQYLDRLFGYLITRSDNQGNRIIVSMAKDLSEKTAFPDLQNLDDSNEKLIKAREAVRLLKIEYNTLINQDKHEKEVRKNRENEAKKRQERILAQTNLSTLKERLDQLAPKLGLQQAGYDFEKWLYDLAAFFDIDARKPYKDKDGRQIDGAITIDGTTYLIEAKFTKTKTIVTDVDVFYSKVTRKSDNTMGLLVSMSGYDDGAVKGASRDRTPLLLLDYSHIYNLILNEQLSLPDVIRRISRHASHTGEAYLSVLNFSGLCFLSELAFLIGSFNVPT